jgi:small subunit ribosomal protein S16
MLRIRLQRFGKKKAPVYRIVVIEGTKKRDGKPVERLGIYNPKTKELILNTERAKYWQSVGAVPSDTVSSLLKKEPIHDLINGPYKFVSKSKKDKEEAQTKVQEQNTKKGKAQRKREEEAAKEAAKASEEAATA